LPYAHSFLGRIESAKDKAAQAQALSETAHGRGRIVLHIADEISFFGKNV